MTVARMREEMPGEEYTYWTMYYARKAQRQQLETLMAQGSKAGR